MSEPTRRENIIAFVMFGVVTPLVALGSIYGVAWLVVHYTCMSSWASWLAWFFAIDIAIVVLGLIVMFGFMFLGRNYKG